MEYAGEKYTGSGVLVSVINTGVDPKMERLREGWTLSLNSDGKVTVARGQNDRSGRGTKIARCLRFGAPEADIVSLNIFNEENRTNSELLARAIQLSCEQGVQVINISFGTSNKSKLPMLEAICQQAWEAGILIVASGHPKGDASYPADIDTVIGVISHKDCKKRSYYFDPEQYPQKTWKAMSGKLLTSGYWSGRYKGSGFAAARLSAQVACLREALPASDVGHLRHVICNRAFLPQMGFGYV